MKEIYLFLRDLLKFSLTRGQCFINNDSAEYVDAKNILINIFNYICRFRILSIDDTISYIHIINNTFEKNADCA